MEGRAARGRTGGADGVRRRRPRVRGRHRRRASLHGNAGRRLAHRVRAAGVSPGGGRVRVSRRRTGARPGCGCRAG